MTQRRKHYVVKRQNLKNVRENIQNLYQKKAGILKYRIFKNEDKIRFWYPHGSIHDKDPITLGTREYAKRFQTIERLRGHSKSDEKNKPTSWYHELTHNPVLILGAEMSQNEWDIWFALVNRERNFAKNENQQFKYPIFQMRECECTQDHRHKWFEPVFSGLIFNEQWEELGRRLG